MASGSRPLNGPAWGIVVAFLVACLVAGAIGALLGQAGDVDPIRVLDDPQIWRALRFTFVQAGLSTLISMALGVLAARALALRGPFRAREIVLAGLSVPIVLPSLIAIFGIVAVYGNNGWIARLLRSAGLDIEWNLYGLGGILVAHVFFNMPLAIRLLLPAWNSIPSESWRLAAQLGLRGAAQFRLIEWPVLKRYLPQAVAILFMICATSFSVILTLGGGPRATTLEIVIFEALRYDANPPKASILAVMSLGLTLPLLLLVQWGSSTLPLDKTLRHDTAPGVAPTRLGRWLHRFWIGLAVLVVAPPLLAAIGDGLLGAAGGGLWTGALPRAIAISLGVSIAAGCVGAAIALAIVGAEARVRRANPALAAWLRGCTALPIALSPMALALGIYLLVSAALEGQARTLVGIVLMNGLIAVPFLASILRPALERNRERHDLLCLALGLGGISRWRLIDWPNLRGAIGSAVALGVAFSLGDLVAVGLYGDPSIRTLSLLLYDQLAAYRMEDAAATSLVLMLVVFAAYRLIERGIGGRHAS